MNGESNTTSIIIALAVLVLFLVGTVLLIRFIIRHILSLFSRRPSQRSTGERQERNSRRSRGSPTILNREEPTLIAKTPARKNPPAEVHPPDSPPPSHPRSVSRRKPVTDKAHEAKTRRPGRTDGWISKDGTARVAGRDIGGMVYVGRGPRTRRSGDPDNAFIDSSKNVSRRGGDYEGQGMDYWPNYSTIDSRSRATYLDWLSSERSDTRYDVGYVFLYFYGLERRVFVDKADAQERSDIVTEVRRLLEIYGYNHSIRNFEKKVVTLVPSSMRQASWTRATPPSLSSSTTVTRCRRMFCLQSVGWRRAANH